MLHFVPVRYDEVFSKHTQGANILTGQKQRINAVTKSAEVKRNSGLQYTLMHFVSSQIGVSEEIKRNSDHM